MNKKETAKGCSTAERREAVLGVDCKTHCTQPGYPYFEAIALLWSPQHVAKQANR